jgi:hypothetical protein
MYKLAQTGKVAVQLSEIEALGETPRRAQRLSPETGELSLPEN